VWPPYADPSLIHYGIPVRDDPGEIIRTRELVVIGEAIDADQLAPGRAIGRFRVVDRRSHHAVTTALLRARRPQPIKLGVIHRADTLGAPQMNVFLDPGLGAG
jgi:hypothetical protein